MREREACFGLISIWKPLGCFAWRMFPRAPSVICWLKTMIKICWTKWAMGNEEKNVYKIKFLNEILPTRGFIKSIEQDIMCATISTNTFLMHFTIQPYGLHPIAFFIVPIYQASVGVFQYLFGTNPLPSSHKNGDKTNWFSPSSRHVPQTRVC